MARPRKTTKKSDAPEVQPTKPRKLNIREKKLVENLANPKVKSVRQAAIAAGYAEKTASTVVYKKLEETRISDAVQNRINRALKHHQVTPEEVLGSAVFQMRSSMDDLMDENGFFDLKKARETGAVDLIKEIEFEEKIDLKTRKKTVTHKVKFTEPSAARKEVANYIGVENFESKDPTQWTDEDLAKELFTRLIKKHGWSEKKAIEGIKKQYPAIDVEVLKINAE